MKFFKYTLISTVLVGLLPIVSAHADDFDREGVRGDTYCFPAKFVVKTIEELAELEDDKKDIVDINMDPQFLIYDEGALPDRYFLRSATGETDFTISPDGRVPDFLSKSIKADKDDDVCITDPARAGLDADDESLYFEMGLTPYFKNRSGVHPLEELKEGAKDGKSQYKKMIPSVARLFMPDTDHLHVKFDDKNAQAQIFAKVGDKSIPLQSEAYNEGFVFDYDDLEDMGAEALIIKGGAYKLSPVPSVKTMKKFGIGKPRGPKASL